METATEMNGIPSCFKRIERLVWFVAVMVSVIVVLAITCTFGAGAWYLQDQNRTEQRLAILEDQTRMISNALWQDGTFSTLTGEPGQSNDVKLPQGPARVRWQGIQEEQADN